MLEPVSKVSLSQSSETAVQTAQRDVFAYRCAYRRSADTRTTDDLGQDYLTFYERENTFAFALCDGVSQSFYGGLAARMLGMR